MFLRSPTHVRRYLAQDCCYSTLLTLCVTQNVDLSLNTSRATAPASHILSKLTGTPSITCAKLQLSAVDSTGVHRTRQTVVWGKSVSRLPLWVAFVSCDGSLPCALDGVIGEAWANWTGPHTRAHTHTHTCTRTHIHTHKPLFSNYLHKVQADSGRYVAGPQCTVYRTHSLHLSLNLSSQTA